MFPLKKNYIIAKDIDSKRKPQNQSQKKFWLEKGIFCWVALIQAVVSKTLGLFYKIFFCLQNKKNQPLEITMNRDKWDNHRLATSRYDI